jgi:hypothetical protein
MNEFKICARDVLRRLARAPVGYSNALPFVLLPEFANLVLEDTIRWSSASGQSDAPIREHPFLNQAIDGEPTDAEDFGGCYRGDFDRHLIERQLPSCYKVLLAGPQGLVVLSSPVTGTRSWRSPEPAGSLSIHQKFQHG